MCFCLAVPQTEVNPGGEEERVPKELTEREGMEREGRQKWALLPFPDYKKRRQKEGDVPVRPVSCLDTQIAFIGCHTSNAIHNCFIY